MLIAARSDQLVAYLQLFEHLGGIRIADSYKAVQRCIESFAVNLKLS